MHQEYPSGYSFKLAKNMSLLKQIVNTDNAEKWLNLAVIMALAANLIMPYMAEAMKLSDLAKNSQETTISQKANVKRMASKKSIPAKPALSQFGTKKVIKAVITAYTSTPDQTDSSPFIAASGKRVHDGMIAANGLPFGTKIKIPSLYGDKIFVVEDRMNKRYGFGRMDIWMNATKAEARKFGVKRVEVEIFYPEKKISMAK